MSPIGKLIVQHMNNQGVRSQVVAQRAQISPGFFSSVVRGRKAPTSGMVDQIATALGLGDADRARLHEAAALSVRRLEIPHNASPKGFEVLHRLVQRVERLQPQQLEAIALITDFTTTNEREEKPVSAKVTP